MVLALGMLAGLVGFDLAASGWTGMPFSRLLLGHWDSGSSSGSAASGSTIPQRNPAAGVQGSQASRNAAGEPVQGTPVSPPSSIFGF